MAGLVNVLVFDSCCQKTLLNWNIVVVDDRSTLEELYVKVSMNIKLAEKSNDL